MAELKNKIGTLDFDSLIAPNGIPAFGYEVIPVERPGVDGALWRRMGRRGGSFQLRSVSTFRNVDEANRAVDSYNKLRATVQNIELNNRSFEKIMITNVFCQVPAKLIASSNSAKYEVVCQWEMYVNA